MARHLKILIVLISVIFLTSFRPNFENTIWYPNKVDVLPSCPGQEVEFYINISTSSDRNIKVHSFNLDKINLKIFIDSILFSQSDTIIINKETPIRLKIRYILPAINKQHLFSFNTNAEEYKINYIKINYGQYLISIDDVNKHKEQFINISESCKDSILVRFPYGGTVSSVRLYRDSSANKNELKSIGYGYGGEENYICFSKADIGRYLIYYSSCNFGGQFWLNIK